MDDETRSGEGPLPADPLEGAADEPDGGDAACWLSRVCPECGALVERPLSSCWRCGEPIPELG